jgi:hypothetical protein
MPITIICPNCDARLSAPETVLGKKVKCKKCDEPFVAGQAAPEDAVDERPAKRGKAAARSRANDDEDAPPRKATKARGPVDDEDQAADEPRPKAKTKGKKKKKQGSPALLFVLFGVGALVLIGGGLGIYFGFIKEDKLTQSTAGTDGSKGPPAPPKGPPGGPVAVGAWVEHVDAEGKFRISFPGRPSTQNQTVNAGGVQQTLRVTQLQAGVEVFVANAVAIPAGENADPERLLDAAEQQAGAQMQGATVASKQPVTHAGVSGRELVISIQSPAGVLTGVVRLFVTNGRIYTFGVVGPAVQSGSPNVVKYFESLKLE